MIAFSDVYDDGISILNHFKQELGTDVEIRYNKCDGYGSYILQFSNQHIVDRLKSLHIIGNYDRGNFETTEPLTLSLPHVDGTGTMKITDGQMLAQFYLVLRGTAP